MCLYLMKKKQRIVDKEIHKNPKLVKMFPKNRKQKDFKKFKDQQKQ